MKDKNLTVFLVMCFLAVLVMGAGQSINSILAELHEPTFGEKVATVTTAGTRVALSTTNLNCRRCTVRAQKDYRTANTGTVYLGPTGTTNHQGFAISPGTEVSLDAPIGCRLNLKNWYLDAETSGDGILLIYDSN